LENLWIYFFYQKFNLFALIVSSTSKAMKGDVFVINNRFYICPVLNYFRDLKTRKDCKMEPRMMAVLYFLSQRPGELVTREQLVSEIWNNYGGGNEGLSQAVSFLRKLLDDRDKQLIRTISKKGYQLSAVITSSFITEPKRGSIISGQRLKTVYQITVLLYVLVTGFYFARTVFFKTKTEFGNQWHLAANLQEATLIHSMFPVKGIDNYHSTRKPDRRIAATLKHSVTVVRQVINDVVYTDVSLGQKRANDYSADKCVMPKSVPKPFPISEQHVIPQLVVNPIVVVDTVNTPNGVRIHIHAHIHNQV
jgi:DNA-binding winged helix-turn-helix (wHTH) protein